MGPALPAREGLDCGNGGRFHQVLGWITPMHLTRYQACAGAARQGTTLARLCPSSTRTVVRNTSDPGTLMPSRQQARTVGVVLGMHRSGTSILARMVHEVVGIGLGNRLLQADKWNADGYWEDTRILDTHENILRLIGREVMSPDATRPYPAQWWRAADLGFLKCQLTDTVREELDRHHGLWGFKDPRTARLLPLWQDIFAELDVTPRYLLTVRDPRAVSASLARRNGFSAARSQLQWLLHYLDAVRYTGGRLSLIVDYDRWFTDPQAQVQALIRACRAITASQDSLDFPQALATIQRIVKRRLRHHDSGQMEIVLPFIEESHTLLTHAARTGHIPAALWTLEAQARPAYKQLHAQVQQFDADTLAERCRRFLADRQQLRHELQSIPQFARLMGGAG